MELASKRSRYINFQSAINFCHCVYWCILLLLLSLPLSHTSTHRYILFRLSFGFCIDLLIFLFWICFFFLFCSLNPQDTNTWPIVLNWKCEDSRWLSDVIFFRCFLLFFSSPFHLTVAFNCCYVSRVFVFAHFSLFFSTRINRLIAIFVCIHFLSLSINSIGAKKPQNICNINTIKFYKCKQHISIVSMNCVSISKEIVQDTNIHSTHTHIVTSDWIEFRVIRNRYKYLRTLYVLHTKLTLVTFYVFFFAVLFSVLFAFSSVKRHIQIIMIQKQ